MTSSAHTVARLYPPVNSTLNQLNTKGANLTLTTNIQNTSAAILSSTESLTVRVNQVKSETRVPLHTRNCTIETRFRRRDAVPARAARRQPPLN